MFVEDILASWANCQRPGVRESLTPINSCGKGPRFLPPPTDARQCRQNRQRAVSVLVQPESWL
jgi:hypothetical protein